MANQLRFLKKSEIIPYGNISNLPSKIKEENYLALQDDVTLYLMPEGAIIYKRGIPLYEVNSFARDFLMCLDGTTMFRDVLLTLRNKFIDSSNINIYMFVSSAISKGIIVSMESPAKRFITITGSSSWKAPKTVALEITRACNLKCQHCYSNGGSRMENELSLNSWISIIEQLGSCNSHLLFTGGEPMIYSNLFSLIEKASEYNLDITIQTNGSLVTREVVDELFRLNVGLVRISLDGPNNCIHDSLRMVEGSFDKAVNAIKMIVGKGMRASVGMTVTENSIGYISKTIELAYKIGACSIGIGRVVKKGRACENEYTFEENALERMIDQIDFAARNINDGNFKISFEEGIDWLGSFPCKKPDINEYLIHRDLLLNNTCGGCGFSKTLLYILADGTAKPCIMTDVVLGKVTSGEELKEIFGGRTANRFAGLTPPSLKECGDCGYIHRCVGCIAQGLENSKHISSCTWSGKEK